jgi:UDP-GlcNAc:undecaprenyl-phosphate/decaprenyl-phosphate GlcNAc-1-phosphate transferase
MLYLFVFFTSLIIAIFSTPFLINFLTRLNIVDVPGGRRINTAAIPRMGGIMIYGIIVLALLGFTKEMSIFRFMLLSSGLLAVCGILDDLKSLGWYVKFLLQSFSASVILVYIYPMLKQVEFFGTVLPFPIDLVILFFLIVGSVNALNMLDGMDGLVSGFSLLVFMLIFILSFNSGNSFLVILSAAAIGSLIGFLKFNASPAKIFLGDTGSMILGFFLIVSAILFTHQNNPASLDLGFPVILLGVPLIDTLRVMITRAWHGKSVFYPDKSHIHHLISGNNIRHKTTVFIIQIFTVFFLMLSLVYLYYDRFSAYVIFCFAGTLLTMINPLLHLFRKAETVKSFITRIIPEELVTVDLYKKFLLPFSAVTITGLIFLVFPGDSTISADIILLMLMVCGLLFAASFVSVRKNDAFNDLYVILNLFLFIAISALSNPLFKMESVLGERLLYVSSASVLFMLGLFMLTRRRLFSERKTLFSGIDLVMLIFLVMLIAVQGFVSIREMGLFGENFMLGFTIYLWYKMVMFFMPNKYIYYMTFALPLVTLIVLWF